MIRVIDSGRYQPAHGTTVFRTSRRKPLMVLQLKRVVIWQHGLQRQQDIHIVRKGLGSVLHSISPRHALHLQPSCPVPCRDAAGHLQP